MQFAMINPQVIMCMIHQNVRIAQEKSDSNLSSLILQPMVLHQIRQNLLIIFLAKIIFAYLEFSFRLKYFIVVL
jgi:hypothetical protein